MTYISNLESVNISENALDLIPESVARENSILPVRVDENGLYCIVPTEEEGFDPSLLDRVSSILNRPVSFDTSNKAAIDLEMDVRYRNRSMKDCESSPGLQCPGNWLSLSPTDDPDIRYCNVCDQNVYLCTTLDQIKLRIKNEECVAFSEQGLPAGDHLVRGIECRKRQWCCDV